MPYQIVILDNCPYCKELVEKYNHRCGCMRVFQ